MKPEVQRKNLDQIEQALDEAWYQYHFSFKPAKNSGVRIAQVNAYITKNPYTMHQPQFVFVHLFQEGGLDVFVTLENSIEMSKTLEAIRNLAKPKGEKNDEK